MVVWINKIKYLSLKNYHYIMTKNIIKLDTYKEKTDYQKAIKVENYDNNNFCFLFIFKVQ